MPEQIFYCVASRMGVNNTQKYLNGIEERETCFGHFQKYEAGFSQSVIICTVFYTFSHIFRPKNAMVHEFGQPFTERLYCNFFQVLNRKAQMELKINQIH